jgi:hypothetical protein
VSGFFGATGKEQLTAGKGQRRKRFMVLIYKPTLIVHPEASQDRGYWTQIAENNLTILVRSPLPVRAPECMYTQMRHELSGRRRQESAILSR